MENKFMTLYEAEYGRLYRFCNPNIPEMFEQIVFVDIESGFIQSVTGKLNYLYAKKAYISFDEESDCEWSSCSMSDGLSHFKPYRTYKIKWDEPMLLPIPDSIFN